MKPPSLFFAVLFVVTACGYSCFAAQDQPLPRSGVEGFVFCSDPAKDQPVPIYQGICRRRQVGTLNCGEKVEVQSRHDDLLRIASAERPPRFVPASSISQQAGKFVPFDSQSGVPDRGAPDCAQLLARENAPDGFVFCSDRKDSVPLYLGACINSTSGSLACGEKVGVRARQGDLLLISAPPHGLPRFVAASAISQQAGKFVPFDDDSGVPDRGAHSCTDRPESNVTPPRVIFMPDPEYSEQARRKKIQGVVVLSVTVATDGSTHDIKIVKGLGYGLDEKAVEAARRWKFKPALKDGEPIEKEIAAEVSFRLH
jgi:TonB family protein